MKIFRTLLTTLLLAVALATPATAQVSGTVNAITSMTRDLGSVRTLTAQVPATVSSADLSGNNVSRVFCVLNMTAHTSSPSITFKIQNKDKASGAYVDLLTSSATTADATPNFIAVGSGLATTANVSAGLPLAATWRVTVIVGGTGTATGTVGCSVQ